MEADNLLAIVVAVFDRVGVPYMLTGSIAAIYYGEPRLTIDIDLVAEIAPVQITALAEQFPEPDFYFDEIVVADAVQRRASFNILHIVSGLKIDVMLRRTREYSVTEFARRERAEVAAGLTVYLARPEDVILSKLEYYREGRSEKHLRDIAGIVKISGDELDRRYLQQWADRLGVADLWQQLIDELSSP